MLNFELIPKIGTDTIRLGMELKAVEAILKKQLGLEDLEYDKKRNLLCAFENSIQITFNAAGEAEFIEFYADEGLSIRYQQIDLFDTPADQVFQLLLQNDELAGDEFEPVFLHKIIALSDSDEAYDYKQNHQRKIWFTIGIGNEDYLASIKEFL